ncbi:MAG: hypothetical protein PF692_11560, partial [Kiritimatiellae bacterium]|nr:hypothetical protein [Kiritimatiellia bacterium]
THCLITNSMLRSLATQDTAGDKYEKYYFMAMRNRPFTTFIASPYCFFLVVKASLASSRAAPVFQDNGYLHAGSDPAERDPRCHNYVQPKN